MPDTAALMSHIVSQTRQNVEFLMSQNEISREAGHDILRKLPSASDSSIMALSSQTARMTIPSPSHTPAAPPEPVRSAPPPASRTTRAKALWAYNENGSEPNDLSFRPGDIIEIVSESNADWWTGRANGKQGLFPSNYVEKIDSYAPSSGPPAPSYPSRGTPQPPASYSAPPPASYSSPPPPEPYAAPPPPGPVYKAPPPQGYNPYMQQAPPPQPQYQEPPPPQQKPSRFGGLGQTMATSAAGGLGFGAGAAIGGDLINSIF
ncbi:hypothetical protein EVG20_g3718 [Dentipellis fragilis]|uniref:SH3 domain-containing protein n=1 Tax=Dentipellis fragilis TaxID=205917 RepID=A0A4Y9Z207_9AGAM|nr:hypothetical protein EVG20_g3718 [Dentipellis fragilis]